MLSLVVTVISRLAFVLWLDAGLVVVEHVPIITLVLVG